MRRAPFLIITTPPNFISMSTDDSEKNDMKISAKSKQKGSSSHTGYKCKGILSIEAALVIPIFFIAMISILSIICIIRTDLKIRQALFEESKILALECSKKNIDDINEIQDRVLNRLGNKIINSAYVDNENGGLDFSLSDISDREIKRIIICYNVKVPYDLLGIFRFRIIEKAVVHTWIGYINGLYGTGYDGEIVYITENSEVYHRSKECTHLKLNISKITIDSLKTVRNSNGEKYGMCRYCRNREQNGDIYITSDGDKYHTSLECSGLKRRYFAVKLSQIKDKRPCQRCGY